MSFAYPGITHCSKCGHVLSMDRLDCPNCKRIKEAKINDLLEIFLNMSDDELQAIKILAKEKSKEVKQNRIKQVISKLEKELEE